MPVHRGIRGREGARSEGSVVSSRRVKALKVSLFKHNPIESARTGTQRAVTKFMVDSGRCLHQEKHLSDAFQVLSHFQVSLA